MLTDDVFYFWKWFFKGIKTSQKNKLKSGLIQIVVNKFIILHVAIGIIAGIVIDSSPSALSRVVIFPLIGVIIGLLMTIIGSSFMLSTSSHILRLFKSRIPDLIDMIYMYPAVLLITLLTALAWVLPLMIDFRINKLNICALSINPVLIYRTVVFALLSLSIREFWQLVIQSYALIVSIIYKYEVDSHKGEPIPSK